MNTYTATDAKTQSRRVARCAISELFVDTELDERDFARLRAMLNESQLSQTELDFIYYEEIAPLLYRNLDVPAGEWAGFDPDWLEAEIGKRQVKAPSGGASWLSRARRYWVTRTTRNDWQKLKRSL